MKKWIRGFTMAEMLTVVSIISLLALGTFVAMRGSTARARDQKRYKDLETIEAALYSYYADNGEFPTTDAYGSVIWYTACPTITSGTRQEDEYIPSLAPTYISTLPRDPFRCNMLPTPGDMGYAYKSDGKDFKLSAFLSGEIGELCDDPGDKFYDPRYQRKEFCSIFTEGAAMWSN